MNAPQTTALTAVQSAAPTVSETVFTSRNAFESGKEMAALAGSQIVPQQYQNNAHNCLVALEMAQRTGSSVLAVMQNLYIVHGHPGWSGQYCIAAINQSRRFAGPIEFEFQGTEGQDDWGCRAVTRDRAGKRVQGPLVTIQMAKDEGWYDRRDRNGKPISKWRTMPELMLQYRAAAFFARTKTPDLLMGLATSDEIRDTYEAAPTSEGTYVVSDPAADETAAAMRAELEDDPVGTPSEADTGTTDGTDDGDEWPRFDEGRWCDSAGVIYDESQHGWSERAKRPSVNKDGTFRARCGTAAQQAEDTQQPEGAQPDDQQADNQGDEEDRLLVLIECASDMSELDAYKLEATKANVVTDQIKNAYRQRLAQLREQGGE